MVFINDSSMNAIISAMTSNVTGSEYLTLLLVLLLIFVIAFILKISMDVLILIITPFILILMAYRVEFIPIGVAVLVYDGVILAKNIFFTR